MKSVAVLIPPVKADPSLTQFFSTVPRNLCLLDTAIPATIPKDLSVPIKQNNGKDANKKTELERGHQ